MLKNLLKDLQKYADPVRARRYMRFFKTGKNQYGEHDNFLGLTNPQIRSLVKIYTNLPLSDIQNLLNSKYHEHRLVALLILVSKKLNKEIFDLYLKNTKRINNWDLVDLSASHIVGKYLLDKDRDILYKFAKSKLLWERRIAILATFTFIRTNDFTDSLRIAQILLSDKEDLMHKAVGWMLREIGKRDVKVLEKFLDKNLKQMPRTMLRYAIEKFDDVKRGKYLGKDYVILVDKNDKPIGKEEKIRAHKKAVLHRSFSILIFNNKGQLLLQQRADTKYHAGGLWTNTCCSHPRLNETTEQAAHRRLQEEMGFDCPLKEISTFVYKSPLDHGLTEHEFDHVFVGKYDADPEINPEEAKSFRWQKVPEIIKDIKSNPNLYTPWFKIIMKKLY